MNPRNLINILLLLGLMIVSSRSMTIDYNTTRKIVDRCYGDYIAFGVSIALFVVFMV